LKILFEDETKIWGFKEGNTPPKKEKKFPFFWKLPGWFEVERVQFTEGRGRSSDKKVLFGRKI